MNPIHPKKISELISQVDDSDLAAALMDLAGRWECPFCKDKDQLLFFPSPESIYRTALFRSDLYEGEYSMPVLALNCGNCGFISNFWPMPIIKRLIEREEARKGNGGHDERG